MERKTKLGYWGLESNVKYDLLSINRMCFSNVKVEIICKDNFNFHTVKIMSAANNSAICGIDLKDVNYVNY